MPMTTDVRMTDFERTAYRNEIDFLQHEVERYKEQNKQLMEIIFKLKDNGTRQYHRKGM